MLRTKIQTSALECIILFNVQKMRSHNVFHLFTYNYVFISYYSQKIYMFELKRKNINVVYL